MTFPLHLTSPGSSHRTWSSQEHDSSSHPYWTTISGRKQDLAINRLALISSQISNECPLCLHETHGFNHQTSSQHIAPFCLFGPLGVFFTSRKKKSESVLRQLGRMTNRLQHNREPKKRVDKSFAILQGRDAHTKWLPHFVFSQNGCSGGQGSLQKHLFSQKANLGGVVVPISFLLQCFLPTLVCYIFF